MGPGHSHGTAGARGVRLLVMAAVVGWAAAVQAQSIPLSRPTVVVDASEPSYVQYGARDLAQYLTRLTGTPVPVAARAGRLAKGQTLIAIGGTSAAAAGLDLASAGDLGKEGFVLRSSDRAGTPTVLVAGATPHGTNAGLATLIPLIRVDGRSVFLDGPLDRREVPSIAVRGLHLNGWPLKYPYAFRSWKEDDWKRFVDIAWAQRINLFYLWPFMEIIPLPLSAQDEAYLQEVKRVVQYAQEQRGMEVWIMQSANRIGVSDCDAPDPRVRTYWVMRDCQQDMNPADAEQFGRIMSHFEALYRIVDNADGFCLIDSDPGGWPGSPLSDQTKIFNGARRLLDQHNVHGAKTKLIDWMWIGWGRHPTGSESGKSGVEFMKDTIANFKANLAEPWELISGMAPYLDSAKAESSLGKTIYLQYGAIEMEPAFPATNLGLEPVREVFTIAARYPELKGLMGNNELMSLQLPRTFYFFETAWNTASMGREQHDVLQALAARLYPEHADLVTQAYERLRANDPAEIGPTLEGITALLQKGDAGRPGAIGRFLFPDPLTILANLKLQLQIRMARQSFIRAFDGTPSVDESARLLEAYFDALLAWNRETGWEKMIDITIWRTPIYEDGKDLSEAMTRLKKVLAQGKPYTSYAQTDTFFSGIANNLLRKYGSDSVMIGCVEPFKLAMIQGW